MPSTFLTYKEQERLACFPDDIQPWDLITYFTLTEHDCSLIDTYQGESNRLVVYPRVADNVSRPLLFHLRGVNQPVVRSQIGVSAPRSRLLVCV